MKPTLFLCALLAAPLGSHAAPADSPAASPHTADDGHDHAGGPKTNEGSLTDYLWSRSDAAFHAGDYARAVALHRAITTADPTDVESYSVGAWLLWSMGKSDEADAFIAQGLKNNPASSAMWEAAGAQYGMEKRPAQERDAYARAVELSGPNADQMLRRRLAHATENAGDLPASATVWRALVKDFPAEAVNKNNLARVEAQIAAGEKPAVATMGFIGLGALSLLGIGAWKRARRA